MNESPPAGVLARAHLLRSESARLRAEVLVHAVAVVIAAGLGQARAQLRVAAAATVNYKTRT